jgi:biopolymer transport protein ExbD
MRRRKKERHEEVELNMAAMLDMAFQLLTFFILTFKPSPIEGQLNMRLPPPKPVTAVVGAAAGSDEKNTDPLAGLTTLVIAIEGDQEGTLKRTKIADTVMGSIGVFENKLREILSDPGSGFDQVIVSVDSRLRYEELMQVIDVCSRQKLPSGEPLTKLSFVELPSGPPPN